MKKIAIDFDGVIHVDPNWNMDQYNAGMINGSPNTGAKQVINELYNKGHTIIIFTSRVATHKNNPGHIAGWLKKHGILFHQITGRKVEADYYIDDRAIRFTAWNQEEICSIVSSS